MKERRPHRGSAGAVSGRAVLAGDQGERLRLRLGPARAASRATSELGRRRIARADRAGLREPARDPRGGRQRRSTGSSRRRSSSEPRRLPGMNEVYAKHVGDTAAGALDRRGREASVRRARRDRGDRAAVAVDRQIEDYVAVARARRVRRRRRGPRRAARASSRRTRTSSCPASTSTGCARRSSRTAGRGARRRRAARRRAALPARPRDPRARAGRDRVRAAATRSVAPGPGRHDFEIVVDPAALVEDDLRRRDFTVNAMARRLADGELVDPFGGAGGPRSAACCAPCSPTSFAEDPLRLVRGLRFVSQLDLDPDDETLAADARRGGERSRSSRASGSAAGSRADGMGELSKLLLGAQPAKALRLARDTGVLVAAAAGVRAGDRLRAGEPRPAPAGRRAHLRGRAGRRGRGRAARRAARALFHDLGKPQVAWREARLTTRARELTGRAGDASTPALPDAAAPRVRRLVRAHMLPARRRRRALRAALAARARRRARVRPPRPQGGRPARQDERRDSRSSTQLAAARAARAGARQPHRLRRPRGRRPDLIALGYGDGPGARPHAPDAARRGRRRPDAEHARAAARAREGS